MSNPETIEDILRLWPTRRALADRIGLKVDRVHKWASAGTIPARYQQSVLRAAADAGIDLSAERLIAAQANAPGGMEAA